MSRVRLDLNISLDGYVSGGQSPEQPMGEDWGPLMASYVATRSVRSRTFGDTSGAGTTGVDDGYAARYAENIGAEILGAGMFGFHAHPDDADWQGWWGEEPPFHCPVFVLTGTAPRPDLEMQGGTTFHFRNAPVEDVLAEAKTAAGGADVRIGGGVGTARTFLLAGLVDEFHVTVTPIILGRGIAVWDDLRGLESGYAVATEVAESGAIHLTFSR
ncbi:dihydrofolate reductase family protein [Nocardioides sp. R-C-SC26]|uniref:dihydrofolate reductase family protein n=1 Tax=Nocardioides sp. R-C-SC26 TaxID=2870414 RepID=UPI001E379031|nr:dihydrofolate reductase family protein [Nocardioides sp. R-C-SC26]